MAGHRRCNELGARIWSVRDSGKLIFIAVSNAHHAIVAGPNVLPSFSWCVVDNSSPCLETSRAS